MASPHRQLRPSDPPWRRPTPSRFALDLLRVALRFLRGIVCHLANALNDLAFDLFPDDLHLVFIRGRSPDCLRHAAYRSQRKEDAASRWTGIVHRRDLGARLRPSGAKSRIAPLLFCDQPGQSSRYRTHRGGLDQDASGQSTNGPIGRVESAEAFAASHIAVTPGPPQTAMVLRCRVWRASLSESDRSAIF